MNNPELNGQIETEINSSELESRHNSFLERYHTPDFEALKASLSGTEAIELMGRLIPEEYLTRQAQRTEGKN